MPTYTFPKIKHRVSVRVECTGGCGKKATRSETLYQTLNPYNCIVTPDGARIPKTAQDIRAELAVEAEQWIASRTYTCPSCKESGQVTA